MSEPALFQQRILTLLADEMQLPVTDTSADLIDDGVLDSLVFVDLIARLEEVFAFEIDLSDLEIDQFRSVTAIAEYITANGGSLSSPASSATSAAV